MGSRGRVGRRGAAAGRGGLRRHRGRRGPGSPRARGRRDGRTHARRCPVLESGTHPRIAALLR
ncbi:hypothetical protein D7D52_35875 [Nocardia yunnanensis]|uniref:Uncharacterized protein n=1 Tax=Nocardia yunnanensis TaxID=2382165 RepID=A0A386ZNP8_9NOCA|nr:hypothetical protein D7D52_35875 [Nocardia yunnanensis]